MRIYLSLLLVALCIYLFVTAPAPLPSERIAAPEIPVSEALTLLAEENKVVRTLWTAEIVGKGKSAGLAFNEDWKEKDVEAGPLPALFLRRAHALTRTPLPPWERALTGLLMAASVIQTAVGCTGSVVGIVRAWGGYGAPFACHVGED